MPNMKGSSESSNFIIRCDCDVNVQASEAARLRSARHQIGGLARGLRASLGADWRGNRRQQQTSPVTDCA
jgi:hypothetical protein